MSKYLPMEIFELIAKILDRNKLNQSNNLSITFIGCTSEICLLPHTTNINLDLIYSDSEYFERSQVSKATLHTLKSLPTKDLNRKKIQPFNSSNSEDSSNASSSFDDNLSWDHLLAQQLQTKNKSFWWLLIICFLGGILTNFTPCVYPMIPITLRVLSQQNFRGIFGSCSYGLGILITYTLLGLIAALTGTLMGGLVSSKLFNLFFGIMIFAMAITMIGYGNFSFIQSLGYKMEKLSGSKLKTLIMGMGAGFVAAPCTGPVLAGLIAYSVSYLTIYQSIIVFSIYSLGFSLPYMALAPTISKFSSIKVPGYIQNLVKYSMSAALVGLAIYYLRIPFYSKLSLISDQQWQMIMYGFIILGTSMILAITFLKQLNNKKSLAIIPILSLGLGIFAGVQFFSAKYQSTLDWKQDPVEIEKIYASQTTPVLVSLWAEWCTSCKIMESTTFSNQEVHRFFKDHNFILIKYDLTEFNDKSQVLLDSYKVNGLPAYVVINQYENYPNHLNHSQNKKFKTFHGLYQAKTFISEINSYLNSNSAN